MEQQEQLDTLRQCYESYLEDCLQRQKDAGALNGLTRLLAGPAPHARRAVDKFFQQVQAAVAALDRTDGQLAAQAAEYMLLTVEGLNDESRLALQAAEGLTLTFLELLAQEDAARILAGYTARYPKRRMLLPKQREVLAALEKAARG